MHRLPIEFAIVSESCLKLGVSFLIVRGGSSDLSFLRDTDYPVYSCWDGVYHEADYLLLIVELTQDTEDPAGVLQGVF